MSNDPDQFEADEDVTSEYEAPSRPSGMVVSVRLAAEDSEKLMHLAEETGLTVSQIARRAIQAFVAFGGRRTETTELTVATEGDLGLLVRTQAVGSATQGVPSSYELVA